MILCLDIGNSQLHGGVFDGDELVLQFRYDSKQASTSDQMGVFLKNVLRENGIKVAAINAIAVCSVVPHLDYTVRSACIKYFNMPIFMLAPGSKTGLKINYRNPLEVGSDRIANAMAAAQLFPQQECIIIDFGTATTLCALSAERSYMGGVILPGMRLSMDALQRNTAKLSSVEIVKPEVTIGRSTMASIQSGLYYMQLGVIKEVLSRISQENFSQQAPVVIGTGGFAYLFEHEKIFTTIKPDLVLQGLRLAWLLNTDDRRS